MKALARLGDSSGIVRTAKQTSKMPPRSANRRHSRGQDPIENLRDLPLGWWKDLVFSITKPSIFVAGRHEVKFEEQNFRRPCTHSGTHHRVWIWLRHASVESTQMHVSTPYIGSTSLCRHARFLLWTMWAVSKLFSGCEHWFHRLFCWWVLSRSMMIYLDHLHGLGNDASLVEMDAFYGFFEHLLIMWTLFWSQRRGQDDYGNTGMMKKHHTYL